MQGCSDTVISAVSSALAPDRGNLPKSPKQTLLQLVTELAALFHDLGKANKLFQGMLRGTQPRGQHLRHELVSYLMLKSLGATTPEFLVRIERDPVSVFEQLALAPQRLEQESSAFARRGEEEEAADLLKGLEHGDNKLTHAILYLVLTHHRQIAATDAREQSKTVPGAARRPTMRRHLNSHLELSPENWQISSKVVPWLDAAWLEAVRQCAMALRRLFEDNESLKAELAAAPALWAKMVALVARPVLIQADHLASAGKEETSSFDPDCAYANTVHVDGEAALPGDSLAAHLSKAYDAVSPYFCGMEGLSGKLPAWTPPSKSVLISRESSSGLFAWQGEAAGLVAAIPDVAKRPFFAIVVSSTGAGKTIGGPKVLAAASGAELRYTCAPGLRSLTLQTGTEYRSMLGIPDADLLTVVGDALYAQLSGFAPVTSNEARGSESLDIACDFVFDRVPVSRAVASALQFTPRQAAWLSRDKQMAMTEVPVLACTVDHLMGASALSTGSDTRMSLRLATSDLILDEIDNYSLEDLQALGRLVHQVGCHGRRVVLMSATVSEVVLQALYQAWRQGLAVWQFRTGSKASPVVALVSNQVSCKVIEDSGPSVVGTAITGFLTRICCALALAQPRVRAVQLPLGATLKETFSVMYQKALEFADVHKTVDTATGMSVSMGFVRFNQVKHCRQFARYLFDTVAVPPGVGLKVQCYHRRMPLIHLTYVESLLNRLLSRKHPQAVFEHPLMTEWTRASPECEHYIVIVATTSIQETGRDHCYDWAIAEPWSNRSIAQLAGRVLRHRTNFVPTLPNIAVLACELNHLEGKGNVAMELGREPLYRLNGQMVTNRGIQGFAVCTTLALQRTQEARGVWSGLANLYPAPGMAAGAGPAGIYAPRVGMSREGWLPPAFFSKGIDASACLRSGVTGDGYLNFLEQIAQRRRMELGASAGMLSLAAITVGRPNAETEVLWDRHNDEIQFRRTSGTMAQLTLDPATNFTSMMAVERHPATRQLELQARAACANTDWRGGTVIKRVERALVPLHLFDAAKVYALLGSTSHTSLAAKLCHSFEVHLRSNRATGQAETGGTVTVDYDPLLGADRHSSLLLE